MLPNRVSQNHPRRRWPDVLAVVTALLAGSCAAPDASDSPAGPLRPAAVAMSPWDARYPNSRCVTTAHYRIYSDLQDADSLDQLAQAMEGAHQLYQSLCPGIPLSPKPLDCFIFARRAEWAAFTAKNTGNDAAVYLQIDRGGYTVNDWFVAFWIGDRGTLAVAAHEGFHQYVARNFAGRLPPALEEGFACMFENIEFTGRLPRWDLRDNTTRQRALRQGLDARMLWPLSTLIKMHAGEVIGMPRTRIEAFYAQNWALAMFFWEGDGRRYRPAIQRFMADAAAGKLWTPPGAAANSIRQWYPELNQAVLEYYLNATFLELEPQFLGYANHLAARHRDE